MDETNRSLEASIESDTNTGRCRICWQTDYLSVLLSPCVCSGTQQFTHFECLKRWIEERDSANKDICDVCQQPYQEIVVKQYRRGFGQWLREGEDVCAKIVTTCILISFFMYLINMGCIQFVISEHKINEIIRFIQLILIIFFSFLFCLIFLVSIYVFKCEFKEWQLTHKKIVVERTNGSINGTIGRKSSDSSFSSYQSSNTNCMTTDTQTIASDQSRPLVINESQHNYGSV